MKVESITCLCPRQAQVFRLANKIAAHSFHVKHTKKNSNETKIVLGRTAQLFDQWFDCLCGL